MTFTKSQQAVVDWAATPLAPQRGPRSLQGRTGWVVQAGLRSDGGGPGAVRETVRILKSRPFAAGELHAVAFETREGSSRTWVVRTFSQAAGCYEVLPIGGGGGGTPHREQPWVNVATQWGSSYFRAGGEVTGDGAGAARLVRMRFANAVVLEDDTEGDWVLFEAMQGVKFPADVEIFDTAGDLLSSYSEFEGFEQPG